MILSSSTSCRRLIFGGEKEARVAEKGKGEGPDPEGVLGGGLRGKGLSVDSFEVFPGGGFLRLLELCSVVFVR